MPPLLRPLGSIAVLALLAGACVRAPAATAPVPTQGAGGRDGEGAGAGDPGSAEARCASDGVAATAGLAREAALVHVDGAPPSVADSPAVPEAPVWDIDVQSYATHARVEDYVQIFTGRAREVFATALKRQTRYGPMIRGRLRGQGLPEDLTYLALVESWFDPNAYSSAAAVGFWQFMTRTARGMGLRVDWWVDERRDPVRSTEAAARLLAGLRGRFGSLYLAAAAYNGGGGRVSRGLASNAAAMKGVEGEDRFFALAKGSSLRKETRDYVPKIIAAALVGEEPWRYGVAVESLPPYAFDSVRVPGGTPLAAVANAVGVLPADVVELNPSLLRGMTAPGDSQWVRVPVGRATEFEERFEALETGERQALTRMTSRKGQSMLSIARAHEITARQLGWFNPKVVRLKSGALRTGQVILVPRHDVVLLARDVPNPSIERYPVRRASAAKPKASTRKPAVKKPADRKPAAKSPLR